MGKRIERGRARFMIDCPKCAKRFSVSVPIMKHSDIAPDGHAKKWLMDGEIKVKHKACETVLRVKIWTMHSAQVYIPQVPVV